MGKQILMSARFLILPAALILAGCAPLRYRDCPDYYVETIPVPAPYPYPCPPPCPYPVPDPGPVVQHKTPPPPVRSHPLVKPTRETGHDPRTKAPGGDRSGGTPRTRKGRS